LRKNYPNEVSHLILPALTHENTSPERKLELAQQLANAGHFEGFEYIIQQLEKTGTAPLHIQNTITIWEIDTKIAITRLETVSHMLIDPNFDFNRFWESPKQFLLEVLFGLAKKTEDDLLLVEEFMHTTAGQFINTFPTQAAHLRWHAERALDQFRESQQSGFPITTIRQITQEQLA
jgi:hypothetical protein